MSKTPLRSRFNRFFFRNQDKGLRNMMLYLGIGNVVVYLLTILNRSNPFFYELLYFNPDKILSGQIWRLFTYPLVYLCESGPLFGLISLFFYYWCGGILEQYWGTLRFNFYYLSGVLLTDLAGVLAGIVARAEMGGLGVMLSTALGVGFVGYVNMSLLLALATVMPEQQVRIYFVIPVKMKWLAWLDLGFTLYGVLHSLIGLIGEQASYVCFYLVLLIPLVPILNYLLFFGKDAANILPDFLRYHPSRKSWARTVKQKTVYDHVSSSAGRKADNARFRCTVCGRTELTNPGLEFRYCSKCAGYRCYCQDHINNHSHISG